MQIVNEKISCADLAKISGHYFGDMTKGVVDVEKEIVAIDAELHADLETLLLENGSRVIAPIAQGIKVSDRSSFGASTFTRMKTERILSNLILLSISALGRITAAAVHGPRNFPTV